MYIEKSFLIYGGRFAPLKGGDAYEHNGDNSFYSSDSRYCICNIHNHKKAINRPSAELCGLLKLSISEQTVHRRLFSISLL